MSESTGELPRRGDVGLAEATRSPIFVFQRRSLSWRSEDSFPDGYVHGDDGYLFREEKFYGERPYLARDEKAHPEAWSCRAYIDAGQNTEGAVIETWHTESVWFTREEGEAYGRRRAYNYPDGWRVYCVCAEGDLATILKARSTKPTGVLDP